MNFAAIAAGLLAGATVLNSITALRHARQLERIERKQMRLYYQVNSPFGPVRNRARAAVAADARRAAGSSGLDTEPIATATPAGLAPRGTEAAR